MVGFRNPLPIAIETEYWLLRRYARPFRHGDIAADGVVFVAEPRVEPEPFSRQPLRSRKAAPLAHIVLSVIEWFLMFPGPAAVLAAVSSQLQGQVRSDLNLWTTLTPVLLSTDRKPS